MKKLLLTKLIFFTLCTVLCAKQTTVNNDGKLEILNLFRIFDKHIDAQAKDLIALSKSKAVDVHMALFDLMPEGNPPADKISRYEKEYKRLRSAIGEADCNLGILVQTTMGHGWQLQEPFPYQRLISREDGGSYEQRTANIVCPLDKDFQKYLLDAIKRVAMLKPSLMMIDGDFRLFGQRKACLCPLHLAKLKEKYGYSLTRKEVVKHLYGNSEFDKKVSEAIFEVSKTSLIDLAKKIRATIDSVDPTLHCQACSGCPEDMACANALATTFAAKGRASTIRIGNARYAKMTFFDLFETARRIKVQYENTKPDRFYAELDSWPHNRYFTPARALHAAFVASIMEGASGAKYWPNRFTEFEPNSGIEYKKIFIKNRALYDTLYAELKGIDYSETVADVIVPSFKTLRPDSEIYFTEDFYWTSITGVLGLPVAFANIETLNQPIFLRGETAKRLSVKQLEKILTLGAVLDGFAAIEVCERGLGNLIGVKASKWNPKQIISSERLGTSFGKISGNYIDYPKKPVKLEAVSRKTEVLSEFVHLPSLDGLKSTAKTLSPATTYFENEKGGKVVVFASSPEGFNHFTESKKALYVKALNKILPMPIWYAQDAQAFFKVGKLKNGAYLVCFTNVGIDPFEGFVLGTTKNFKRGEYLDSDGTWKKLDAKFSNGSISVDKRLEIYMPLVMRFWE